MAHANLVHRWSDLPTDRPMEKLARQRVIGEKCMVSRIVLEKGCDVPAHAHENEQIAMIIEGELEFRLGEEGEAVRVRAGESLMLPANLKHSALALERTVALDVFSPPSEKTGIDRS